MKRMRTAAWAFVLTGAIGCDQAPSPSTSAAKQGPALPLAAVPTQARENRQRRAKSAGVAAETLGRSSFARAF